MDPKLTANLRAILLFRRKFEFDAHTGDEDLMFVLGIRARFITVSRAPLSTYMYKQLALVFWAAVAPPIILLQSARWMWIDFWTPMGPLEMGTVVLKQRIFCSDLISSFRNCHEMGWCLKCSSVRFSKVHSANCSGRALELVVRLSETLVNLKVLHKKWLEAQGTDHT